MAMNRKDWTDSLSERLENYSETEPEGLWDAVQAGIKPHRRRAIAWWYAAGALALAASVFIAVLLWPVRPASISLVPGDAVAQVQPLEEMSEEPMEKAEVPETPVKETKAVRVRADAEPSVRSGSVTVPADAEPEIPDVLQERAGAEPETVSTEPEPDDSVSETAAAVDTSREQIAPVLPTESQKTESRQQIAPVLPTKKPMRLQAGFSATGLIAQNTSSVSTGYGIQGIPGTKSSSPSTTGSADISMLSRNKASTTTSSYSQSARLAIGLILGFQNGWGLETGIVSTTLRSESSTTSGRSESFTERRMNYVGIPLYLHWNALSWKIFDIYFCGGPMYETCVGTATRTDQYLDGSRTGNGFDRFPIVDRRWSLNAGAGLQIRLSGSSALFAQPGFSWHFRGTADVDNYYSEHPASLGVTFGYRMSLL